MPRSLLRARLFIMRFFSNLRIGIDIINMLLRKVPYHIVQAHYPLEFHGTEYGGYTICPSDISYESIIYSFGIGEDVSFENSLMNKYKLNVFAFDPTPKSLKWVESQKLPNEFRCFEYGIADYDGTAKFYPPANPEHISHTLLNNNANNVTSRSSQAIIVEVRKLKTIMDMLGHKKIDILKMDIEGAEYGVIRNIIDSNLEISQILVEFHHRFLNNGVSETNSIIKLLNRHDYKIFSISDSLEEYSFINENFR